MVESTLLRLTGVTTAEGDGAPAAPLVEEDDVFTIAIGITLSFLVLVLSGLLRI